VEVGSDTSYLDFPRLSRVNFHQLVHKGKVTYSMSQPELRKLIATTRFLVDQNSLLVANENLLRSNIQLMDSTRKVLELKYEAEVERTRLFETAYESAKKLNNTFQSQLDQCAADLQSIKRENSKVRRQSFLKGSGVGFIIFATLWLTLDDR
jgi:hypothetical protein